LVIRIVGDVGSQAIKKGDVVPQVDLLYLGVPGHPEGKGLLLTLANILEGDVGSQATYGVAFIKIIESVRNGANSVLLVLLV